MPKSNYNNGHEYEKAQKKLNQSSKSRPLPNIGVRNIGLPKIDKLLAKNPVNNSVNKSYKNQYLKIVWIERSSAVMSNKDF